jgi:two-component system sensor histidine kinase SenX3
VVKSSRTKKVAADAVAFLEVLSTAGVILDSDNDVINQSSKAKEMVLVEYSKLTNTELLNLVEQTRKDQQEHSLELYFQKNFKAPKQYLAARATMLSEELVILLVEDRTEAKRLEETRRDFVENISHELKTPISAIGLLSEALQGAVTDPDQVQKFARNLQIEAKRLGALVTRIIELSRIQAGDLHGEIEKIDLAEIIEEAVDANAFLAERNGVKLSFDAEEGIEVEGDSQLLVMALKNLVENAVLYSEPHSQVGVGLKVEDDFAEITVIDNGIGIPVDQQERIFERFYRVDPSRSRDTGGTGLGLSIVKHAALNHGGEVTVFSRVGLGSTFTLKLPLAQKSTKG